MTTQWDRSVDLVIAGSGGGGMVAGLAALDCGLEPLIVEKQALVGGSTGLSGGIVWLPNNPLMRADGIADSHDDGLAYLADVVGDIGAPSSPERREMFLTAGYEMINFLIRKGVQLIRCDGWSDYYPNHKGGNSIGRAVEGIPFDAAELGSWSDKVQPPLAKNYGYVVLTNELRSVQYFNRAPKAFAVATRVFIRTAAARIRRRQILTNGASLIAQMLKALIDLSDGQPPLWINAAMDDLIVEDGRVVGARIVHDGTPLNVEARKGVSVGCRRIRAQRRDAAAIQRRSTQRRQVVDRQRRRHRRSAADCDATGREDRSARRSMVVAFGFHRQRRGRRRVAGFGTSTARRHLRRLDRQEILQRVELLRGGRQGDVRRTRRCRAGWSSTTDTFAATSPAVTRSKRNQQLPSELIDSGAVKRADTIEDLARQTDLPADELTRTIQRFNQFAVKGLDPDFGRGQSAYNDCLGDPGYRPNAAVGPLDRAPFYATRVLPADVGTCGGVITNEYAQVLDEKDQVIDGLYATGNTTATVMGRTYPGAGASIASSMVFGYVAARHAAGRKLAGEKSR